MTSIADEIDRLAAQRAAGHLSETEFEAAKAHVLGAVPIVSAAPAGFAASASVSVGPSLRRSLNDRWIGGVCGGIARATAVESWIVRLLFFAALFFGGFGLIPYILLWIFIPLE